MKHKYLVTILVGKDVVGGGAIVSDQFVLTHLHTISDDVVYDIYPGFTRLQSTVDGNLYTADKVYRHSTNRALALLRSTRLFVINNFLEPLDFVGSTTETQGQLVRYDFNLYDVYFDMRMAPDQAITRYVDKIAEHTFCCEAKVDMFRWFSGSPFVIGNLLVGVYNNHIYKNSDHPDANQLVCFANVTYYQEWMMFIIDTWSYEL